MPTMTVPTANMRRLRRNLEISRMKVAALAPTGGVAAKKTSPPPPRSPSPAAAPPAAPPRADDGGRARATTTTTAPSAAAEHPAGLAKSSSDGSSSPPIGKGALVRVRTPVGTAPTGARLVLWLRAVVVASAADEDGGYLRVTYDNARFQRDDPSGTVRVARSDVKLHALPPDDDGSRGTAAAVSTGSSGVTTANPTTAPQPRPTVAGKKLHLVKKLEKEMRRSSKAILD